MRAKTMRLVLLLWIPAFAGACGVGAVEETPFVYGPLGPEGGTVSTQEVTLVVPPGALAGPTTISILPEANPLPIQPPPQDPCTYAILGPQYCCGPVGLELLEDGRLAVTYDEALLPDGVSDDDLVLLLWDEALGALVPADTEADHDTGANRFTVDAYDVLGHLAVGYSTCPQPGVVFLGFNPNQFLRAGKQAGTEIIVEPSGLWLVGVDEVVEPVQVPTDDVIPGSFLPSPDGGTVMYEVFVQSGDFLGSQLFGVPTRDGVPVLLAGDDEEVDAFGPTFGWMRDGTRVFFQEQIAPTAPIVANGSSITSLSTVPGDGSEAPASLHTVGEFTFLEDVRQSLDGNLVMVAYFGPFENLLIDVIESADGTEVSSEAIPYGGGQSSPRFLPDSSGLYLVDTDGESVDRYDPDGTDPTNLFTPPAEHGFLKDFVLAPNGDDYAYIANAPLTDLNKPAAITVPGVDFLYLGSLSGGLRASVNLEQSTFYNELFFHPDGQHVFLDTFPTDVLMFRASDGIAGPNLGIEDVEQLDVSADDGRLLLVIRDLRGGSTSVEGASNRGELAPGLYVADADGQNQQLVTTPAALEVRAARWLRTVRRAPCMAGSACFR